MFRMKKIISQHTGLQIRQFWLVRFPNSVGCLQQTTKFSWHFRALQIEVHTSYLSRTHGRCPWRKNLSCGEISNFCTWNMWRKLKFLHKWINFKFFHMTDVEKSEISFVVCTIYGILLHFTLFCCKICFFWRFSLFCRMIVFCDLRAIMWRKI